MKKEIKYGFIGLLIGGGLVWLGTTTAFNSNNSEMMQLLGMRGANQAMMSRSNTIDAHFIEQMIPHHQDAITMAELAQTKAQRPEIKQLANSIIASQGQEINQMKEWYKNWFGKDVSVGENVMSQHGMMSNSTMHMGMMGDETDTSRLETASDFDRAFIEEMIPHHQMAVMMANMLKNSTNRSEMKKLAEDIITAQTNEIKQMRDWYSKWK